MQQNIGVESYKWQLVPVKIQEEIRKLIIFSKIYLVINLGEYIISTRFKELFVISVDIFHFIVLNLKRHIWTLTASIMGTEQFYILKPN